MMYDTSREHLIGGRFNEGYHGNSNLRTPTAQFAEISYGPDIIIGPTKMPRLEERMFVGLDRSVGNGSEKGEPKFPTGFEPPMDSGYARPKSNSSGPLEVVQENPLESNREG